MRMADICTLAKTTCPLIGTIIIGLGALALGPGFIAAVAGFLLKIPKVPILGLGIPFANTIWKIGWLLMFIAVAGFGMGIAALAVGFLAPAVLKC